MAAGAIEWFEEAMEYMLDGGWEAADSIKLGLTSSTPAAADAVPAFVSGGTTNYTEVTPATGNYTAGGEVLDTWTNMVTEVNAIVTIDDTGPSVSWLQNASNPTNARWGIIYNSTDTAQRALAYIDLGAVIDMTAGDLTITWNASGIATITKAP